jgi:hypothetical protein
MSDLKTTGHRPIASLTPRLLARKGGAKPAMRPQASALAVSFEEFSHDDLGWNDMGHDADEFGQVVSIDSGSRMQHVPEVVRQQRGLSRDLGDERRSALADGRRAAFTLRVDADRHLQLRLACTVQGRSAQQLVTEALDRLLAEQPDIAQLAAQVAKSRK